MTAPTLARPACPSWCDGYAHQPIGNLPADPTTHTQESIDVAVSLDDEDTCLRVGLTRLDSDEAEGATKIGITLNDGWIVAGCSYDEEIRLTPDQARAFAATLLRLASQGEPR